MVENNQNNQLSNKEQYELKRQEKLKEQNRATQKRDTKLKIKIIIAVLVVGGALGGLIWYLVTRPSVPESEIVSRNGLHWHPELQIYVNGEIQKIPENIGIGVTHKFIHTHNDLPILHLEFSGVVYKKDITLDQFFKSWGKDINSFGENMKMTVNGQDNTEYENYVMGDKDKIELRYE